MNHGARKLKEVRLTIRSAYRSCCDKLTLPFIRFESTDGEVVFGFTDTTENGGRPSNEDGCLYGDL